MTLGMIAKYWPFATYQGPFLEPFPSISGGAHLLLTTLCPPSPCLACLTSLLTLPFPW